jgi:catechol 2,3-dioxygenase-like lactoylglutathione lyase family enzyme
MTDPRTTEPSRILGLHHVTLVASNAQRTADFYTGVLGLRLVKTTVNFDDPGSYHLYFSDETGSPTVIHRSHDAGLGRREPASFWEVMAAIDGKTMGDLSTGCPPKGKRFQWLSLAALEPQPVPGRRNIVAWPFLSTHKNAGGRRFWRMRISRGNLRGIVRRLLRVDRT